MQLWKITVKKNLEKTLNNSYQKALASDMPILNKIAYDEFSDLLNPEVGKLHSVFKAYQKNRDDVCLIHK